MNADLETSCGFVALIGAPNAGKSTLLNAAVGAKVAIVTHKVQTTRSLVRGIAMHGPAQIVFVDTPGIFAPKRRLDRAMVNAAWSGAGDADVVALLVDARAGVTEEVAAILEHLKEVHKPALLILNKIDLVERERLLALAEDINRRHGFERTFMISALKEDGLAGLMNHLAEIMPKGVWLYPEDQAADLPMRLLAAEVTREKLFLRLHEELPYALTVETEKWEERKDGSVRIEQMVYVGRVQHRKMVLGAGGKTVKAVSQAARLELEEMLGRRVHLFLYVKVAENWMNERAHFAQLGLDFPSDK